MVWLFTKSLSTKPAPSMNTAAGDDWRSTLRTFVAALVVALLFRSFLLEPFHIPSGSMKPGLLVGDFIFVTKYDYGYSRYSFPLSLPLFEGRIGGAHRPERGEVVVFRLPTNPSLNFIKRVIGLPGDHIQLKDGYVWINGTIIERIESGTFLDRNGLRIPKFKETLPDGKVISITKRLEQGPLDNTEEWIVPQGHYFMLGDNRDDSQDSRVMDFVGFISDDLLIGKARWVVLSVDAKFFKPWTWLQGLDPSRFFLSIH
jgi:signal peptidase I